MIKDLFKISTAIGISVTIASDGLPMISACEITTSNKQLDFGKKVTALKSTEELTQHFQHKAPVALNLSGKGILVKQVEKIEELTSGNFAQILPNAGFEDFYVQNFISGDRSFVSVIRKTEADKWINEIKILGYPVVMLSLGAFPADAVLPQLNFYDEEVVFDGHLIKRDENKHWIGYRHQDTRFAEFQLKIENEKIDERLIMAYACAFQLVMSARLNLVEAPVIELYGQYKNTQSLIWLKAYGTIVIIGIFILLLINFVLFSWIAADNTKLSRQVSTSAQSINDIRGIEEQIKSKEERLKVLGWDGGINKAYLIDQLASGLPEQITWKSIGINPVDQSASRIQKAISFKDRQIRVTGLSQQIIPVNEWMARIKVLKWVKGVQLENFGLNQELNTGQFTLIITY